MPLSGSTMYHAPPFRAGSHHRVLTGTGLRGLNRSLFETQACLWGHSRGDIILQVSNRVRVLFRKILCSVNKVSN